MKYNKKLADLIVGMVAKGEHTIKDICTHVGVSEPTYYHWRKTKLDFLESLKEAESTRLDNLGELARSGLFLLLSRHEVEEVVTEIKNLPTKVKNAQGKEETVYRPVKVSERKTKKVFMPNPTAVIFALTNLDAENFKHRNHTDVVSGGKSFMDLLRESSHEPEEELDTDLDYD